jgi:hypothetical protein
VEANNKVFPGLDHFDILSKLHFFVMAVGGRDNPSASPMRSGVF